jgi:hypothetical protein
MSDDYRAELARKLEQGVPTLTCKFCDWELTVWDRSDMTPAMRAKIAHVFTKHGELWDGADDE